MVHTLLVGRLPSDITADELNVVFGAYGRVEDVQLTGDGSATVRYARREDAEDAIEVLHKIYKIRDNAKSPITVRWSKELCAEEESSSRKCIDQDSGDDRSAPKGHKLFVGGLPDDILEEELKFVFSTYGTINHIHIMKPMASTGLRAAFIFYDKAISGDDAIKVLDKQYKIRYDADRTISVKWGDSSRLWDSGHRLFVSYLPVDITEQEIRTVFSTYGHVNLIHIMSSKDNGSSAALVFYEKRESGDDAITVLNDKYKIRKDALMPIRVRWGKADSSSKGDKGKGKQKDEWNASRSDGKQNNVWQDQDWHANNWHDAGWSNSSQVWKDDGWHWNGDTGGRSRGWEDDRGRDWKDDGWNWNDDNSRGRGHRHDGKRARNDTGKTKDRSRCEDISSPSGMVYVANLPEDITQYALEFVFNNYGAVQRVRLNTGKSVKGAITAIVEYSNPDDAETAIASLNHKYEIREGFGPILVKHTGEKRSQPY